MLRIGRGGHGGIGGNIALVGVLDRARLHRGGALVYDPAGTVMRQLQLDHAEAAAPVVGHHRGHAVDRAAYLVHARQVELRYRAGGIGEDLVRVADQHGVHAGHLGQVPAAVLHGGRVSGGIEPAVRDHHHQVGALGAHLRHELLSGFLHALRVDLAVEPALVPAHDRGRRETDDADLDRDRDGLAVGPGGGDLAGDDGVRLEQRRARAHAVHVGQHLREGRPGARRLHGRVGQAIHVEAVARDLVQVAQAVVELVVADAAAVELRGVHHFVHGQRLAALKRVDLGLVVGQRRALDGVAVVQQQGVGKLGARLLDQGCHALEAEGLVLGQLEVVVAAHIGVQVSGLQQGQRGLGAGRDAIGLRRDTGARAGAGGAVAGAAGGQQRGGRDGGGDRGHGGHGEDGGRSGRGARR